MRRHTILFASFAILLCVVSVGISEDKPTTQPAADGASHAAMDSAAMAEMMKYAAPAEHHKHLETLVGAFDADVTMWMTPGSEPQKSTGQAKNEMILGGRYLQGTYTGEFMGQPFHGITLTGYDNYAQKYVNLWIDDMSTIAMVSEGSCDAAGKVFTLRRRVRLPHDQVPPHHAAGRNDHRPGHAHLRNVRFRRRPGTQGHGNPLHPREVISIRL